ncbi:Nucleolar protein 12 [Spatholobus suberectus]|nr:Nucleolar protein 12 [Spatholobus suberectus]
MEEDAVQRKGEQLKKRSLKNKALGITFNEKDLKDYVTGFHKRKKKRRKEAQKQQHEALRRKRNEERKKRKLERELALYGGVPPDEIDECQEEVAEQVESIADTKTYENADLKVTVVTSEINPEEESYPSVRKEAAVAPHSVVADKRQGVPISNRKSFKKVAKQRSRPKLTSKRDKKKGKKRGKQ